MNICLTYLKEERRIKIMVLVNCGCGNKYVKSPEWVNIDFNAANNDVRTYNILKGLPFEDNSVDAIFSSCMLEHFTLEQALAHCKECHRVLKKGGIIRIVVPDLEDVCREYLRVLDFVRKDEVWDSKYEYILIELIDQMTRTVPGGEMQKYWDKKDKDEEYVMERTGYPEENKGKLPLITFIRLGIGACMRKLFGKTKVYSRYNLGKFMLSGEVHKWMYDEYSLGKLLKKVGFDKIERKQANESNILGWKSYNLEMKDEKEYKPHCLYVEAIKSYI